MHNQVITPVMGCGTSPLSGLQECSTGATKVHIDDFDGHIAGWTGKNETYNDTGYNHQQLGSNHLIRGIQSCLQIKPIGFACDPPWRWKIQHLLT